MATGKTTSDHVAKLATTQAQLNNLALLGTFGSDAAPAALVRLATGRVKRIERGDTLSGRRVMAIDAGRVLLSGATGEQVLRLPKG